jgi:hypothetical protein
MRTLADVDFDRLVNDFYAESGGDLVGLWELAKEVEELIGAGSAVQDDSTAIVRALLARGLRAGTPPYSIDGYEPWPDQHPDAVVDRIRQEWDQLGRMPSLPDIVWFGR